MSASWNSKNPAVRRILADIRELARDPSDQYAAKPLEENMFEWHFTIRGPKGTDYEGGIYHGRIVLPNDYPFKPPSIMLLTPNGRWEVKQKICLSISSYHPEQWQPAWGIRTILEALISFMNTPGEGAVGALDCSPELRKKLAKESLKYKHPLMPALPEQSSNNTTSEETRMKYANQIKEMHLHKLEDANTESNEEKSVGCQEAQRESEDGHEEINFQSAPFEEPSSPATVERTDNTGNVEPIVTAAPRRERDSIDQFLHHISIGLMMAIFAILYRKALQLYA